MRVLEPGRRPGDHGQRQLERDARPRAPGLGEQRTEVLSVNVLHRQEVDAGVLADLEDLRNVLMVQRGSEPRLIEEHLDGGRVVRPLRQDHLQDDVPLEATDPDGATDVDPRHPTRSDGSENLVLPEMGR